MTSYRRSALLPHLVCAGESRGGYDDGNTGDADRDRSDRDRGDGPEVGPPVRDPDDPGPAGSSPLGGLVDAIDDLEAAKRRLLDRFRDVAAWGGTAQTTGYTHGEYLTLVGRLAGGEVWKYQLLVRRLPACPVTAALLKCGQLTFDQALTIVAATRRLSGDTLKDVEQTAAEAAVARNRRGDDPDIEADVDLLVQQTRTAAEQDRRDRDRLDRNSVGVQPDLFGAGRITEEWADPEGFQTRLAAIEHAAGPPTPDSPRGTQLAEGSLATARAWLAGRTTHPSHTTDTSPDAAAADPVGAPATPAAAAAGAVAAVDTDRRVAGAGLVGRFDRPPLPGTPDDIDLGPSSARPTFVVRIDLRDLQGLDGFDPSNPDTLRALATGSSAAFGRLAAQGRLSSTPWLGRQLLDTLACNLDLLVAVVDGERPLAEFRRTRRLPDRIRRQVLWRDMGCRWPSCRAPIAHCDVHHLDQNPTNHAVDNLIALCRRHHRRLHSTFWHWRLDGTTGRFDLLRSPDGAPVHTTYPRGTPPQQVAARTKSTAASGTASSGGDPPEVP